MRACALFLTWYNIAMSLKKRLLIGLPMAIAFYFAILSLMWAANVENSYFQKLPEALVTFGTLVLALAAFRSIKNSNDQEKRRRADELSEERRLRDKDELNEIIDWAVDVAKCEIPQEATAIAGITNKEADRRVALAHMIMLGNNFRVMIGKSLYTSKVACMYGSKFETATAKLTEDLQAHLEIINECRDAIINNDLSKLKDTISKLETHWQEMYQSTDNVITEACDTKFNILNI